MSFRQPRPFRRCRPSTQSANLPIASVSSAVSNNLSISLTASDVLPVSSVPSVNISVSSSPSDVPPVSSAPSDLLLVNAPLLVNCNTIEPSCRAPGIASLYLPVEHLLTLPGRRAFTQHHVPSEPARTDSAPARGPSAGPYSDSEGTPHLSSDFDCGDNLLTDGLQISHDPLSRNSRKKMRQWQRWSDEVIPSLVRPFLRYQRLSRKLRNPVTSEPLVCKNNCVRRHLKVVCIGFNSQFIFPA